MILADEPAYDLPPISRALKFADFDRLCVRLVNGSKSPAVAVAVKSGRPLAGEMSGIDQPPPPDRSDVAPEFESGAADAAGAPSGGGDGGDYWTDDTATDPGGYHGEIELTPVGAVPVVELEG